MDYEKYRKRWKVTVLTLFVAKRLEKRSKSIADLAKQNKPPSLISRPPFRPECKDIQRIATWKQNCSLFAQLYVSCQSRKGDRGNFLRMKTIAAPIFFFEF